MDLDHENAYVRYGIAAALAEAVEQWSQSASQTIKTLCDLYREKVRAHRTGKPRLLMTSAGENTGPRVRPIRKLVIPVVRIER